MIACRSCFRVSLENPPFPSRPPFGISNFTDVVKTVGTWTSSRTSPTAGRNGNAIGIDNDRKDNGGPAEPQPQTLRGSGTRKTLCPSSPIGTRARAVPVSQTTPKDRSPPQVPQDTPSPVALPIKVAAVGVASRIPCQADAARTAALKHASQVKGRQGGIDRA